MEATSEKGYTDHLTIYSTNIVLFRCMHLCLFIFSVRVLLRLMKSAKIRTALNSHAQTHTHTHTHADSPKGDGKKRKRSEGEKKENAPKNDKATPEKRPKKEKAPEKPSAEKGASLTCLKFVFA